MSFFGNLKQQMESKSPYIMYAIVFAVALLGKIIGMIVLQKVVGHGAIIDDSAIYLQQADNIMHGHWAGEFPNGYPLIITLFALFPAKLFLLVALNCILSSLVASFTAWIVYQRTQSKWVALIAGIVLACWYNQINWSTMVLTEAPSTFFLVLGVVMMMQKKSYGSGFAIGLASVIRTTLLPVGFLLAGYYRSYKLLLGLLLPIVLMFGASYYFTGTICIGGNFAQNIYIASHLADNGQPKWDYPEGISTRSALTVYSSHFLSSPLLFLYQRFQQWWILWGFWPFTQDHGIIAGTLLKILIGLRFPLLILAIYFFSVSPRKTREDALLLIPMFVVTVVHTMLFAELRYTYTVEPLLVALLMIHGYFFFQKKQWIPIKNPQ